MSNQKAAILNDGDWDTIIDNIESGKTIVCIGAEIFNTKEATLSEQLQAILQAANNPDIRCYSDGLFHFKGSSDTRSFTQIKKFYKQELPDVQSVLSKIAAIRLPVVMYMSPDHQLKKAFDDAGHSYEYRYYFRKKPAPDNPEPELDQPVIYNLLGDLEMRESMVLTYNDLFDYFESIVEHKSMPEKLRSRIYEASNFIFIGLPFEKWYMQLLLRVLRQHTNEHALKLAANNAHDQQIEIFCRDQFNITCVPTQIDTFVSELYERCHKAGLLRPKAPAQNLYTRWKNMVILHDQLKQVLQEMTDFVDTKPGLEEELKMLFNYSGRLAQWENRVSKGTISEAEAKLERSQIRDGVVNFLEEVIKIMVNG